MSLVLAHSVLQPSKVGTELLFIQTYKTTASNLYFFSKLCIVSWIFWGSAISIDVAEDTFIIYSWAIRAFWAPSLGSLCVEIFSK